MCFCICFVVLSLDAAMGIKPSVRCDLDSSSAITDVAKDEIFKVSSA